MLRELFEVAVRQATRAGFANNPEARHNAEAALGVALPWALLILAVLAALFALTRFVRWAWRG